MNNDNDMQYNKEVNLLDTLYEFHPNDFKALTANDFMILRRYYCLDAEVPENIFEYRRYVLMQDASLEDRAREIANEICKGMGILDFLEMRL